MPALSLPRSLARAFDPPGIILLRRSWLIAAAVACGIPLEALRAAETEGGPMVSIWQVVGEQTTVFLAGSVHLLREADLPIPQTYEEVYDLADEVVFELDMAELLSPAAALRVQRLGSLPADETLEQRVGAETMGRLRDYLNERSIPPTTLDRLQPGMAYLTIGTLEAMAQGAKPEHGLEMHFYRKALSDDKPTGGLETIDDQIGRLVAFDDSLLVTLIEESLDEADKGAETLDQIVESWKLGDTDALADLVVDKMGAWPEVKQSLLVERNEDWIEAIENAIEGERCVMFLVGAAHLVGEGSVVDLLEKRGHTVEQLHEDSLRAEFEQTETLAPVP